MPRVPEAGVCQETVTSSLSCAVEGALCADPSASSSTPRPFRENAESRCRAAARLSSQHQQWPPAPLPPANDVYLATGPYNVCSQGLRPVSSWKRKLAVALRCVNLDQHSLLRTPHSPLSCCEPTVESRPAAVPVGFPVHVAPSKDELACSSCKPHFTTGDDKK